MVAGDLTKDPIPGTAAVIRDFEAGKIEGPVKTFFPDGTPKSRGSMRAGLAEGPWEYWNSDGSSHPGLTGVYEAGQRVKDGHGQAVQAPAAGSGGQEP